MSFLMNAPAAFTATDCNNNQTTITAGEKYIINFSIVQNQQSYRVFRVSFPPTEAGFIGISQGEIVHEATLDSNEFGRILKNKYLIQS